MFFLPFIFFITDVLTHTIFVDSSFQSNYQRYNSLEDAISDNLHQNELLSVNLLTSTQINKSISLDNVNIEIR